MNKLPLSRRQALALAALPFFSGCNRDTKKRIGVVPKGRAHLFWQSVHAGAKKRLAKAVLKSNGTGRRRRPISTVNCRSSTR